MLRENRLQGIVDEGALSRPRHTADNDEFAERKLYIYILQVVATASVKRNALAVALTPLSRNFYFLFAVEILSCQRVSLQHISWSALEYDFSTFSSGFRSHINNPVGGSHHILVMLHDNDCIAEIAQLLERVNEFDVVALM